MTVLHALFLTAISWQHVRKKGLQERSKKCSRKSPYMLLVAQIKKDRQIDITEKRKNLLGIDLLNEARSDIPAVTHIDYSARIQTVHEETNPHGYDLRVVNVIHLPCRYAA